METFKNLLLSMPLSDAVFDRLATAANHGNLCANPHLNIHQWNTLWRAKLPVDAAVALVARRLEPDQIDAVLAVEKRSTVLSALLDCNEVTVAQMHTIVANRPTGSFAVTLMQSPAADDTVLDAAAALLDGVDRLEWCVNTPSVPDADVVAAILAADGGRSDLWRRSRLVTKAVHSRPSIVDTLFDLEELPDAVQVVLAGSRLVTDVDQQRRLAALPSEYVQLALVANPVVHAAAIDEVPGGSYKVAQAIENRRNRGHGTVVTVDKPFEQVDDLTHLSWLLSRSLPTSYKPAGRPWDLVALAMNPNIDEETTQRILDNLSDTIAVAAADVNRARTHLAALLNREPPEPVVDTGFWTVQHSGVIRYRHWTANLDWVLDPGSRPWTDEQIRAAAARFEPNERARVDATKMASIGYTDPTMLHAILYAEFGDDPARFEMALNLAVSHLGDFASLRSAVRKLIR